MPMPDFLKKLTKWTLWPIYEDLLNSGELYTAAEYENLLTTITADPPMLMDPEGIVPTGYKIILRGKVSSTISYADLGAAMVELGQRKEEFAGKTVGLGATGRVNLTVWDSVWVVLLGLKNRLWPF
jgi:hypothetical protein